MTKLDAISESVGKIDTRLGNTEAKIGEQIIYRIATEPGVYGWEVAE